MERRSNLSDVLPEPKPVERRPLIDHRKLRSCGGLSRSASSIVDSSAGSIHHRASSSSSTNKPKSLDPSMPAELGQQLNALQHALHRSQSAPHHFRPPHYRVNPVVKFDDRAIPESMNYGIAGYNTSRRRSFSSIPDAAISRPRSFSSVHESSKPSRPRSFSSVLEPSKPSRPRSVTSVHESSRERPRSFSTIHESSRERPRSSSSVLGSAMKSRSVISRSVRTPWPATTKAVNWRSLTQRFRDKVGKLRVRDSCSKFLSRFRG